MVPLRGRVRAPVADTAESIRIPADRAVDKFGMCDDAVVLLLAATEPTADADVITPFAPMPLTMDGAGMLRRDTIGANVVGVDNVIADADEVTFDALHAAADATG